MKGIEKKCLSGSVLKWIAILTMLVDHVGACLLVSNFTLRQIGRIAFPLFCFLIAEGAVHTRDMKKYLLRLGVFAVFSELPFDLAFYHQAFYCEKQNVYWTLFLGLAVIWLFKQYPIESWKGYLGLLFAAGFAEIFCTDYGAAGVLVIVLMYVLRHSPWFRFFFCYGILVLSGRAELWSLPAFFLMAL